MKKLISILLCLAFLCGVTVTAGAITKPTDDVVMLYDGESGEPGGGAEEPWGQLTGPDYEYFTQGESSFSVNSYNDGLMFFMNIGDYLGVTYNLEDYEYIEFDIRSSAELICDLELSVIDNGAAHHGSDCQMFAVYLPAEEFVHVKMPLSAFETLSTDNRDKWDENNDTKGDPELDWEHYAGYSLDCAYRLRWQFTYCTDVYGEPWFDEIYMLFDNVIATKNGAGSESTLCYWEDVKDVVLADPVKDVEEMIAALPEAKDFTAEDADAVVTASDAFNALTQEEQERVSEDAKQKLNDLLALVYPPDTTPGDLTGDGTVDAKDALAALKHAVGKPTLSDDLVQVGDLNGDGVLDAKDALAMLKIAVSQ